jgi:hypothetical protein
MKPLVVFLLLFIFIVPSAFAQRGQVDSIRVSGRRILNEYTILKADAEAGSSELVITDTTLNRLGRFSGPLKAGDLLLILQLQGAEIAADQGPEWGAVTGYRGAGNYEWTEVKDILPNGRVRLNCELKYTYLTAGKSQVVRVPRYKKVILSGNSVIGGDVWDGEKGGVIALEISDALKMEAGSAIDAGGIGFRGGKVMYGTPEWAVSRYASIQASKGAEKGESIAGWGDDYTQYGGKYCRGAAANGGGGGNAHNCGGGGGANGGQALSWTGNGNPDTSNPTWKQAWELEATGFSAHRSDGGGKGGYSFSGVNNNALTVGPGIQAWDGDWRRNNGGLGGRPLDDNGYRLFAGGGGGAGDANDNAGGGGGNGGGIIAIRCYGTITGTGKIAANGANGSNAGGGTINGKDGAGGGGGGGSILLALAKPADSGITIEAKGGRGGNQDVLPLIFEGEGPGGGGSGGRVYMPSSGLTVNVSGGSGGTTDSRGFTEFPANGATGGGKGSIVTRPWLDGLSARQDTLCSPGTAQLVAMPNGAQDFFWSDRPGGEVISTSDTLRVEVQSDTTFYLSSCKAAETLPVSVVFTGPPAADAGNDTTACKGLGIRLNGKGNGILEWLGPGITQPNVADPLIFPDTATAYVLNVTSPYGCSNNDTVVVSLSTYKQPEFTYEQIGNYAVKFRVDSLSGQQYRWLIQDNRYDGKQCLHDFPYDGNYEAALITIHPCGTDTLKFQVKVVKVALIGALLKVNSLKIYPNPAEAFIRILPGEESPVPFLLRLFDTAGRLWVKVNGRFAPDYLLPTASLPPGAYLLEVQTDKYLYRSIFFH